MYQSLPYEVRLIEFGENEKGLHSTGWRRPLSPSNMALAKLLDIQYKTAVATEWLLAVTRPYAETWWNVAGADVAVIEATYSDAYEEFALNMVT